MTLENYIVSTKRGSLGLLFNKGKQVLSYDTNGLYEVLPSDILFKERFIKIINYELIECDLSDLREGDFYMDRDGFSIIYLYLGSFTHAYTTGMDVYVNYNTYLKDRKLLKIVRI